MLQLFYFYYYCPNKVRFPQKAIIFPSKHIVIFYVIKSIAAISETTVSRPKAPSFRKWYHIT